MDKYVYANMMFSKFSKNYMDKKKDLPIRPSELGVLNIITQREGQFTPLMIKELLGVSKPMVTAHINVLEKKGYVTKSFDLKDKRSFYVVPTQKAKLLVEKTKNENEKIIKEIESVFGEEQFISFVKCVEKAQKILEKEL